MAWGEPLTKITSAVGRPFLPEQERHDKKIILYVTEEEKGLFTRRAAERKQSVNSYIRKHLEGLVDKLKELYEGQENKTED